MTIDKTNDAYWAKLHALYSDKDWITKPSMFAEFVTDYLPEQGALLELGAGLGQDSAYFAEQGYKAIATDLNIDKLVAMAGDKFATQAVDLREKLPFDDNTFEVVYAHLSLHYFDEQTTEQIFAEIYRILKPGGVLAFLTNATADPEYGQGKQIGENYFEIEGTAKRYFNVASATEFARAFKPLLADNNGATYKDEAKGVHNLIRFIGSK
jgi:SAM-dependent methyltransferase